MRDFLGTNAPHLVEDRDNRGDRMLGDVLLILVALFFAAIFWTACGYFTWKVFA